jgi:prepilin peptidase CpaA
MDFMDYFAAWLVTVVLIVAAVIDGIQLKVPNWLTFPFVISGWIYSVVHYVVMGEPWYEGFGYSLLGTAIGLGLLLIPYAIGGMGAGDVKLLAGVGAWLGWKVTFYGFAISTVVGAVMAVVMVLYRRDAKKHCANFLMIFTEWMEIRNPKKLSEIAAERKSRMLLLPYGIPICIGCIGYFMFQGMMF